MKRVVSAMLVMLLAACYVLPSAASSNLEVHFLDVGQGDCAIVLCDGESMVIDGGPKSAARYVYAYIRESLKLVHIDYIVSPIAMWTMYTACQRCSMLFRRTSS